MAGFFPGPQGSRIGIGGDAPFQVLNERLNYLLKGEKLSYGVARISIGGIREGSYVGEAGGAVFPITGEGIRPSIMHAYLMSKVIKGESPNIIKSSILNKIINAHLDFINKAKNTEHPGSKIVQIFMGKANKV
ncbi:hypothetical protein CM19_00095 [Candidatus Acidianus copahuensis]|uniref:Uncharacterized protein n=1 Tax=Candidatus Acidianus copahuensis TaxID=1160895 RepID=A0A031LWN7_9CREN|nr:hypothetical protein CM19_00095 [Candidatus Acidianus copahuensis]